jgi:hypothetical protein
MRPRVERHAQRSPFGLVPVSLQWHNPFPRPICAAGSRARPRRGEHLRLVESGTNLRIDRSTSLPRPRSRTRVALVVVEEGRQDLVLDLVARRGPTTVYEPHHVRVAVEFDKVLDVVVREPSQLQALGFEKDLHRRILPNPRVGRARPHAAHASWPQVCRRTWYGSTTGRHSERRSEVAAGA